MDETTTTTTPATPAEAPAAAPTAQPTAAPDVSWVAEKFRVMGQDGALDLEATARKLAQGYSNAERLVGADRVPPEDPSGYRFTPPEYLADAPIDNDSLSDFQTKAHEAGLSQAQFEFVLGEFYQRLPALLQGHADMSLDQAKSALAEVWTTPSEMRRNMEAVERAVGSMSPELAAQVRTKYRADPVFWRFAAEFGREVGEDTPPAQGGSAPVATDVEALMRTDAYRNAKHPDHAKVSEQVRRAFEQRYGDGSAR